MAIAQLMRDMRRPVLKEIVEKNKKRDKSGLDYYVLGPHAPQIVYLYGDDLFTAYSDSIDWVPKLSKLTKYGRPEGYLTEAQIANEATEVPLSWTGEEIKPIEGWPTENEIAAEIAASAEREKKWSGSLSSNDFAAAERMLG
jgi:hypothetical protein